MSYHHKFFPSKTLFAFYCGSDHCHRPQFREFAVEFVLDDGSTAWRRHIPLADHTELAKEVKKPNFRTLHVGAIHDADCNFAKLGSAKPQSRELVFDLDLQDYSWLAVERDDQAANDRHMPIVFASAAILEAALRLVFGFEKFLRVYSGRRGCHLYVLDNRARALTDEARAAICAQLSAPVDKFDPRLLFCNVVRTNPNLRDHSTKCAINAAIDCAAAILLADRAGVETFVTKLFDWPQKTEYADLHDQLKREMLLALQEKVGGAALAAVRAATAEQPQIYRTRLSDVLLSLVWPRLDTAASKLGHCVKAPFSLHAKTGRVALPIPSWDSAVPIVNGNEMRTCADASPAFKVGLACMQPFAKLKRQRPTTTTTTATTTTAFTAMDTEALPDVEDLGRH